MAKDLAYNAEHDIHIASNLRLQGWKEEKMLVMGLYLLQCSGRVVEVKLKRSDFRKVQQ